MTTVLLHGFWGQPSDWNTVLQQLPLQQRVMVPDLFEESQLLPTVGFSEWSDRFWHWLDHQVEEPVVNLVGYSMGARLALGALLKSPARVNRALLVSGNPVLDKAAHGERLQWEHEMARRFLNDDWETLSQVWQEQPVFAASPAVERRQSPQLREILGLSFTNWSPRLHGFGWKEIQELPASVEWAFGALDQKYLEVAKSLQDLPVRGQIALVPNVGHRVIHEAPTVVSDWISSKEKGE